jgi:uncharacterized protein (DUF1499 family)
MVRWLTKNWANTHEPTHSDLAPLTLSRPPGAVGEVVRKAVTTLPRWRVESETPGELKLTRRTRLVGFVDDITVTIQAGGSGSILHAASRSRVGIGDLGQNRRNILELWAAIRANS